MIQLKSGFEELEADDLKAGDDDGGDAFHDFVAEGGVVVTVLTEACAIEENGVGGFGGAGAEMPIIRGEEPGPTEDFAGAEILDAGGGIGVAPGFEGDSALADQVEAIGRLAFAEDDFVALELFEHGGGDQAFQMVGAESFDEAMGADSVGQLPGGFPAIVNYRIHGAPFRRRALAPLLGQTLGCF
jgi:hypothetical protein